MGSQSNAKEQHQLTYFTKTNLLLESLFNKYAGLKTCNFTKNSNTGSVFQSNMRNF